MTRDEAIESITLTKTEALYVLRILDKSRDAIQAITKTQATLYQIDLTLDIQLDLAANIFMEKMK